MNGRNTLRQSKKAARHAKRIFSPITCELLEIRRLFAFGVTTGTTPTGQSTYVIDNGADVTFSVIKGGTTSSTIHLGDISSIKYKGQELLAPYSTTSRYSHYEQGLGSTSIISFTENAAAGWILVTCDDSAESTGGVIQYYAVRQGDDNIYMASLPTDVNNGPGEGRIILYLNRSVFANPEPPSDDNGTTGAIEGSDVYGQANGTTTSKFYNMNRRMIDNIYHGLTGTAGTTPVGAWMFMGNRETSSGGPFFKDIDYQGETGWVEMYNCIFTGHTQTEPFRQGLKGPYALQLNGGSTPITPDYSWLQTLTDSSGNLLIHGLIPSSQRGSITGVASGVPAGHQIVVALSNTTAQYWAYADATTGAYSITGVLPGTYTETLYDTELEVGRKTVTITVANNTTANIVDSYYIPASPIFRIGTWDGTPLGFLNTENDPTYGVPMISIMHPSDVRMANWDSTPNFTIGTNTDSQWPAVQFMGVNNNEEITFNLTAAQVQNLTFRVGITWGFSGARPRITVNAGQTYSWLSAIPSASADLNSRGITRGTWRGDNQLYTYNIPSTAFRAGTNTITLPMVSGSFVAGQTWLSPNVAFDAIDLVPTTTASTPTIASVTITPVGSISASGTRTFTAVAKDSKGNILNANFNWSASSGAIDPNGNYIAPASAGTDTITATAYLTQTPGYATSSSSTSAFTNAVTATSNITINVVAPPPPGTWTGAADGLTWSNPGNWSNNQVPTSTTNATIGSGFTVKIPSGSYAVNSLTASSPIEIATGATLQLFGPATFSSSLTVDTGGMLKAAATPILLTVNGSSFTNNGSIDLGTNDMILHNGNPTQITPNIFSSSATTSTTLAVEINNDGHNNALLTTFDGQTVITTDVLVKFTYFGDSNLNGSVDAADYIAIDNGFNQNLTGWNNGDFNYDGKINGDDYTLIDNAFNTQGTTPFAIVASPQATISQPSKKPAAIAINPSAPTPAPFADPPTDQSIWDKYFDLDSKQLKQ